MTTAPPPARPPVVRTPADRRSGALPSADRPSGDRPSAQRPARDLSGTRPPGGRAPKHRRRTGTRGWSGRAPAAALVVALLALVPASAPDGGTDRDGTRADGRPGAAQAGRAPADVAGGAPVAPRPTSSPTGGTGSRPADAPGPTSTRFGVTVQSSGGGSWTSAFAAADARYGGLEVYRAFYPGAPSPWPGAAGHGKRPVVVSFRYAPRDVLSGRHDATLARWFRTAPTGHAVYWVYNHEPEDDVENGRFTAADYRAAWRHLRGVQRAAGRSDLLATLALMCWTIGGSDRNWRDYYPGDDVIDVMAWDCYNWGAHADPPRYADPAQVFGTAVRLSAALGKPFGIAETGSARIAGDSAGTGRAAWLRAIGVYLSGQRAAFVCYFDVQKGRSAVDYRLTDPPSQQAWRAVTSGR